MTKLTKDELVKAVRWHANENYGKDGWDFLVECWSDEDITKQIGCARTLDGAIRKCRETCLLLDERRRSELNERF